MWLSMFKLMPFSVVKLIISCRLFFISCICLILFVEFDKDNRGNIDEEEFGMIMMNEFCRPDATRGNYVQVLNIAL